MPRIYTRKPPSERFWAKVRRSEGDGCWLWVGAIADTGYGVFSVGNGVVSTHRYAYTLQHGSVPDGLWVLHRCDVRHCVRADHLFLGTGLDNVVDMDTKGRRVSAPPTGIAHHFAKLTPESIREARELWGNRGRSGRSARGVTLAELAVRYGVSTSSLHAAITGKTWRD